MASVSALWTTILCASLLCAVGAQREVRAMIFQIYKMIYSICIRAIPLGYGCGSTR